MAERRILSEKYGRREFPVAGTASLRNFSRNLSPFMIGLPNYVVGATAFAPMLLLALGICWASLLAAALTLAAANGHDAEGAPRCD
jgi:hypothetical protein